MVQGRGGPRFTAQPFNGVRIIAQGRRKKLQRDRAAQACVLRAIDDAHSASAQLGGDPVVRDRLADHEREGYPTKTRPACPLVREFVEPRRLARDLLWNKVRYAPQS